MPTTNKYKVSLAGIEVWISDRGISDTVEWALARQEFPNTDGALVENMGQKGVPFQFTCHFLNDDYDLHKDLYEALSGGLVELVHPEYGVIRGYAERLGRRFDDRERCAELDVSFLESRLEPEQPADAEIAATVEGSFSDALDQAMDEFRADVTAELGTEGASIVKQALDSGKGILEQFSSLTGAARSFVAQVDSGVRALEGTLAAIAQPANSIIATVNYATDLPGRVIGSLARTVERYAQAYQGLRSAPARFSSSLKGALSQLESSFSDFHTTAPAGSSRALKEKAAMNILAKHVRIAAAQRLSLEAAYAFSTDQRNRQAAKRNEGQKSFDALGNYLHPVVPDPMMNSTEIEAVLADAMAQAQAAVNSARGMAGLKSPVAALVAHARKIKLEADRIYTVDIENTLPLFIICLKYGLPYNAAERILAINPQIKNPSFVSGTIKLYAKADA